MGGQRGFALHETLQVFRLVQRPLLEGYHRRKRRPELHEHEQLQRSLDASAGPQVPSELLVLGQRELLVERLLQIRLADHRRVPQYADQLEYRLLQVVGRHSVLAVDELLSLAELAGLDRFAELPERGVQRRSHLSVPAQKRVGQAALVRENLAELYRYFRQQRDGQGEGPVHVGDVQEDEERCQSPDSYLHFVQSVQLSEHQSVGQLSGALVLP